MPDATARPGSAKYKAAMRNMLEGWNAGLVRLDGELGADRDRKRKLVPYGDALLPEDRKQIPESDMPPGDTGLDALAQAVGHPQGRHPRCQARHGRGQGADRRAPLGVAAPGEAVHTAGERPNGDSFPSRPRCCSDKAADRTYVDQLSECRQALDRQSLLRPT